MTKIDELYQRLLHFGLLNLREAVLTKDLAWASAEAEFLHNIPSLIGESNRQRHVYFWEAERQAYLDWVARSDCDAAKSRLATFHQSVLTEMAPLQRELANQNTEDASQVPGKVAS